VYATTAATSTTAIFTTHWALFFEFSAFCPEVNIGLGIPRAPIRIVLEGSEEQPEQRVVGVKNPEKEYTQELTGCADAQQHWVAELCGYIFKKDSPSCGMERVKAWRNDHPTRKGTGLFAQQLIKNNPLLPCEEEGRLNDLHLRENFVERVYVYSRWKQLAEEGITAQKLVQFHSRHKFIILSHNQKKYRELGQLMSNIPKNDLDAFANNYISQVMAVLKKPATRKNHINVLQHLQGYLRPNLDGDDKKELLQAIEICRTKDGPLTVPRTLLRHYFRKFPDEYIARSYYLQPYPDELNF
jgi:Uncharacterized conserved protein